MQHPYEALSALRENGALLEPNVMIGVRPLSAMHEAQVLKVGSALLCMLLPLLLSEVLHIWA